MRRETLYFVVFMLLLLSSLAELPPAPPAAPGGFEEQISVQEVNTIAVTESTVSVEELQQKITSLEAELSAAQKNKAGLLSTPFIISLSVNITLLILIFYLLKKAKEQTPQF